MILLTATAIFVSLFKRLGLGSVLGFLAAGVILGPSGFTITEDVEGLRHFTELGVVLFLFLIGLEMQPKKLWSMRRLVLGLGSAQVLLTGVMIGGVVYLLGVNWQASLILGLGFALSSTAFVMQLLGERGDMATEHGESSFAILIMQDLAIVPLLALVPLLSEAPGAASEQPLWLEALMVVGAILGVYLVGRYLIPIALAAAAKGRNQEAFVAFAMLSALGAAYVMELVGVSMALGAFMMGMMFSASEYRHQIEASVEPFKGVLIGFTGGGFPFPEIDAADPFAAQKVIWNMLWRPGANDYDMPMVTWLRGEGGRLDRRLEYTAVTAQYARGHHSLVPGYEEVKSKQLMEFRSPRDMAGAKDMSITFVDHYKEDSGWLYMPVQRREYSFAPIFDRDIDALDPPDSRVAPVTPFIGHH